jgi:hypothetical protein
VRITFLSREREGERGALPLSPANPSYKKGLIPRIILMFFLKFFGVLRTFFLKKVLSRRRHVLLVL